MAAGVRAIVAESFNNAHRRNLIGMGIWPLKFVEGQSAESLGLRGDEEFAIELPERTYSRMPVHVRVCFI
jgi:aconitate hydratase